MAVASSYMTPIRKQIYVYNAERLKAGEAPMTQRRLAALTGVNPATVSRHARIPTVMKAWHLRLYATALGCSVDDLVVEEEA
jgi:hypothetical protein